MFLVPFPRRAAPNLTSAMDKLFELFPDHYPLLFLEDNERWIFRLEWPTSQDWYVDPHVSAVAKQMYDINPIEIASFYEVSKLGMINFVFSMFHSRSILAASLTTAFRKEAKRITCIVHIDDHTDLMPSFFQTTNTLGYLYEPVFGQEVSLTNPNSIITAINSGIIHKGNFLSSYLLMTTSTKIIHVKSGSEETKRWIWKMLTSYELAGQQRTVTTLEFRKTPSPEGWQFQQISDIPECIPLGNDEGIWLDIDLDAFCNRYDGDSDKKDQHKTVSEEKVLFERLEKFIDQMSKASWVVNIEAVSVAVSPAFFPSDYWTKVIPIIRDNLQRIICRQ